MQSLPIENEELKKQLLQFEDKAVADLKKQIITSIETTGAVKFFASTKIELNSVEALRKLGIQLTTDLKENFVLLLASSINGKNVVHLRISPSLNINGNQLLKEIAPTIKGGGPADFVQASAGSMSEVEELIVKLKTKFA